jgi:hypothetical protein
MMYRGPGFLAVYDSAPRPHPPPSCQQVVSLSQSSCVSPVELNNGGEEGKGRVDEEPNHTTAKKPGPLLIIQYSLGVTRRLYGSLERF